MNLYQWMTGLSFQKVLKGMDLVHFLPPRKGFQEFFYRVLKTSRLWILLFF